MCQLPALRTVCGIILLIVPLKVVECLCVNHDVLSLLLVRCLMFSVRVCFFQLGYVYILLYLIFIFRCCLVWRNTIDRTLI